MKEYQLQKAVFKKSNLKIYNADCINIMKDYKDNYFDLAIVDPPYGIGADTKNNKAIKQSKHSATFSKKYGNQIWDNNIPTKEYFNQLKRVSKNQIIWGINYFDGFGFSGGRIYWNKNVAMPTYSDGELAYCSSIKSIKSFNYTWAGMLQQNMKDKENRIHPTQKPIQLYNFLLTNYATKDFKILDTHLGSGSSAIASFYYGCKEFVGIEIDPNYYNKSIKRIKEQTAQIKLL